MFVSLTRWNMNQLFVTNHLPYLQGILNAFSNTFFDFYSYEFVSSTWSDVRKNEA